MSSECRTGQTRGRCRPRRYEPGSRRPRLAVEPRSRARAWHRASRAGRAVRAPGPPSLDEPLQVAVTRKPCSTHVRRMPIGRRKRGARRRAGGPHRVLDEDRVGPADLVGRAALLGARRAEVHGVAVEPHAGRRMRGEVIHRPTCGHAQREAVVVDDLMTTVGPCRRAEDSPNQHSQRRNSQQANHAGGADRSECARRTRAIEQRFIGRDGSCRPRRGDSRCGRSRSVPSATLALC